MPPRLRSPPRFFRGLFLGPAVPGHAGIDGILLSGEFQRRRRSPTTRPTRGSSTRTTGTRTTMTRPIQTASSASASWGAPSPSPRKSGGRVVACRGPWASASPGGRLCPQCCERPHEQTSEELSPHNPSRFTQFLRYASLRCGSMISSVSFTNTSLRCLSLTSIAR